MKTQKKELHVALDRLEKCCPKDLSDSIKKALTFDLRKALFNLDRARNREQRMKEESDALLEGMNIIISSEDSTKAFRSVLEVLKRLLGFDEAFVLREEGSGRLSAVSSTSPMFESLTWQPGAMLKHVLSGNFVNITDISASFEWQSHAAEIQRNVTSALHIPFNSSTTRAMLICTSSKEGFFSKSNIQLLERFAPLAGQALHNLEICDLLRDEIVVRKSAEAALKKAHDELELRVEQRTEELRASNVLLKSEITERKRAEEEREQLLAQLLSSLREKEMLLREVHHRVKNNMQVISSLLNLQAESIPDHRFREVLNESKNRIRAMALVHEKLYRTSDIENIDFHEYLEHLTNDLSRFYDLNTGIIRLSIDARGVILGIDSAIPCGLIISELISNALKYAFPDGREGDVWIVMKKLEPAEAGKNTYMLIVGDNGIGMPETLDIRKVKSLGMHLVTSLAEHQLLGRIELDRTSGTEFRITFRDATRRRI